MAAAYTKEFLVNCFLHKYEKAGLETTSLRKMSENFYDEVGKDKFRTYCSLSAEAIRNYKQEVKNA